MTSPLNIYIMLDADGEIMVADDGRLFAYLTKEPANTDAKLCGFKLVKGNSTTLLIRANTTPLDEWSRGEIAAYSLLTGLIIGLITPVTLPSTETDIDIDTSGRREITMGVCHEG